MDSCPNNQDAGARRRRRILFTIVVVSALGVVTFLATWPFSPTAAPIVEAHRNHLELREGRWFAPGQSNGFTGLLLDTYDNGAMKSCSTVSNGWLHGVSEGWHTNGQKQVEEHFVNGSSHGWRTKWHSNGQKLSEVLVADGKLEGTFRSWHENGRRAEEIGLKDGQPDGPSKAYFPSGFLKSQVTLRHGAVVEQKFWQDGEYKEPDNAPSIVRSDN